ncbi:MAG: ribosome small subunit-dependent GTPase A [Waddliaceae bacterium]|jgi:ribosome biogenesis GTPase / thiamine phosphate phosphatase|nr:ribosome small subunit-dependent GTPase A [Waddliaceae bacterium]MBT3579410.1 ribosome small subunit-dependent GTPase A [Waddliaceae bacterium]MBT4444823.1 ribosome small subunit-dependent GTPase A [Waddliaceae bacterium]MBT6928546.1 ribosome small subunit-dependent GTPase A [Waddliaceae bacterium]MBT7461683.1 ribosome small subunit-dependent GTPase A [Waddliaceae bacterium]
MKKDCNDHISEEDYFHGARRAARKERNRIVQSDRSKYKKSDLDKAAKNKEVIEIKHSHRGRVLSISSQGILVDSEGIQYMCSLRGALKKEKTRQKRLITVGDFVHFDVTGDEGAIGHIEERRSVLSRADNLARTKEQYIAANIDQVLITISVVNPTLKPSLVDRYIISSEKGNMLPIVVVNKTDLINEATAEEREQYDIFRREYSKAGATIVAVSAVTGEGLDALRSLMKNKASVFAGQSGVGKSSLINAVTGLDLTVGEVVDKTRKGSHTTTQSHLIPLECGGWCVDTPGIKSFGMWELHREEIAGYFPDIEEIRGHCKFQDCMHISEPDCAVIKAVEDGDLSSMRYDSYLSLIDEADEEHHRR